MAKKAINKIYVLYSK